jgi:arylsulfatase A-like enzyme
VTLTPNPNAPQQWNETYKFAYRPPFRRVVVDGLQADAMAEENPNGTTAPNIVLFLVDDMGWQDTSVPFAEETTPLNRRYRTPSMERLASVGMKFTQAYACSVCSPTRVSLMTGLNAARHRVTNWTLRKNASNDRRHPKLSFPL